MLITRLYVFGGTVNIPSTYRNFAPRLLINPVDECLISDLTATLVNNSPINTQTFTFGFVPPQSAAITALVINYRFAGTSGPWLTQSGPATSPRVLTLPVESYEFSFTSTGGPCDNSTTDTVVIPVTTSQKLLQKISVLDMNTDLYGIIEGALIQEDIYPQREGTVTGADVTNFYKFSDAGLDFDINAQLMPGLTAKVVFNTGQLSGYSFDVSSYDATAKSFLILKNKDEKILDLPSVFFRPAIGDKYTLVDLLMPQSYIDTAEQALRAKATTYLTLKSLPSFKYTVECDPVYFRKQNIVLHIGDIVRVQDSELQVDKQIRIVSLTRNLSDEFQYTVGLGDTVPVGTIAALQSTQINSTASIKENLNTFNKNALLNGTYIGTFQIVQGTIKITNIAAAGSTAAMKPLWIDGSGTVWKGP